MINTSALKADNSITVKAIVFDLDGTMMPSYKTLGAIDHARQSLVTEGGMTPTEANDFMVQLRTATFQTLLHRPDKVSKILNDFTQAKNICLPTKVLNEIEALQKEAFTPYEGLKDVLKLAKQEGVPVFIYTNSPDFFAIRRLCEAGISPEEHGIAAMWSKQDEKFAPLSWVTSETSMDARNWADITIPYTYKKPDDTPLRDIASHAGIKPREILFIGEGGKDLETAFLNKDNPSATFCFYVQGAKDIGKTERETNEELRPGAEPLGYDAVEARIDHIGIDRRAILQLQNGYIELHGLMVNRQINLLAPDRLPYVAHRTLVADAPVVPFNTNDKLGGSAASLRLISYEPGGAS